MGNLEVVGERIDRAFLCTEGPEGGNLIANTHRLTRAE